MWRVKTLFWKVTIGQRSFINLQAVDFQICKICKLILVSSQKHSMSKSTVRRCQHCNSIWRESYLEPGAKLCAEQLAACIQNPIWSYICSQDVVCWTILDDPFLSTREASAWVNILIILFRPFLEIPSYRISFPSNFTQAHKTCKLTYSCSTAVEKE